MADTGDVHEIEVDHAQQEGREAAARREQGRCRLLLTNDDGIRSPGLRDLARALAADHDVVVAAPAEDVSGAGSSIGALVAWVIAQPDLVILNVNVPAAPPEQVRGTRWAKIDEFGHFNVASQSQGATVLDLGVRDRSTGVDPGTDTALCLDGYVTLTLLSPLAASVAPEADPESVTGAAGSPQASPDAGSSTSNR